MKCEVCGKEIEQSAFSNAILCSSKCHTDFFWLCKLEIMQNDKDYAARIAIIDGSMFYIGDENTRGIRGFGGREFIIKFEDRTPSLIKTTNLWYNGDIPLNLQDKFPNNARWAE